MAETVLTVDDEPRFVRLIEANLSAAGYQVLTANGGQEALEIIVEKQPNLVLLDVMMPEMDGFKVLDRIRAVSYTHLTLPTKRIV